MLLCPLGALTLNKISYSQNDGNMVGLLNTLIYYSEVLNVLTVNRSIKNGTTEAQKNIEDNGSRYQERTCCHGEEDMKAGWQNNQWRFRCQDENRAYYTGTDKGLAVGQRLQLLTLTVSALLLIIGLSVFAAAAAEAGDHPQALTTSNPSISKDELVLLLVPLSKEELLIEAGGWQEIVKAKAQEIARAEIAVLRDNKAIDKAEALRKKTEATKAQVEKVAEKVAAIDEAEEAKKAEKVDLLENVTTLREERTLMLDNMRIVINELEAKTDKDDADTRARIKDYRRYISTVSGIHVDVSDTTSAWVSFKGWVTSEQGGLRWLVNIGSFLGILVLSWFLAKFLSKMMHKAMARVALSALLVDFLVKSVHWVVMFIGIIWALSALEISIAPLLALVGAAGFIIAFAMQDSLSNFASGLMILFFRPFDMDDLVDAGGVSGKVSSMNLVSTTIRTLDNKLMVVPNSKIWNDVITNATGVTERRVDLEFGIGYSDDIEQAHQILEEIVASHPKVLKDPAPLIKLSALADSSVNFICRPWTETIDYWDVYWDITKEVKKRFDAAGIGIPFPQRDVHLYIEKGMEIDRLAAQDRNSK